MAKKRIGILFGMEDTFPWALMNEINTRAQASGEEIEAGPVRLSHIAQEQSFEDAVILDRISHEVPFYRTYLKCAIARGAQVVNNPFFWSADDKFFDNLVALAAGVAVEGGLLRAQFDHLVFGNGLGRNEGGGGAGVAAETGIVHGSLLWDVPVDWRRPAPVGAAARPA